MRQAKLAGGLLGGAVCYLGVACSASDDASTTEVREAFAIDPDVAIGLLAGEPDYLFGDIRSVAADEAGFIYVGDRIGASTMTRVGT